MFDAIRRSISGELGVTAREYSLIVALVSVSFIVALTNLSASIAMMHGIDSTSVAAASR